MSEKESTAIWLKKEKARKVEARIAKKLEKERVASLTKEELEAEAEVKARLKAEVKARLKAEVKARRKAEESIPLSAQLLRRKERLNEDRKTVIKQLEEGRITPKEAYKLRRDFPWEVKCIKKAEAIEVENWRVLNLTKEEKERDEKEKKARLKARLSKQHKEFLKYIDDNYTQDGFDITNSSRFSNLMIELQCNKKSSKDGIIQVFIKEEPPRMVLDIIAKNKTLFQNFTVSEEVLLQEKEVTDYDRSVMIDSIKGVINIIHKQYTPRGRSDNDVVYLWKNQYDEYKIGITSKKIGTSRIEKVAEGANMTATIIHYVEVNDALGIEKVLLQYGKSIPRKRRFDGSTEFRTLTNSELDEIAQILSLAQNKIKGE